MTREEAIKELECLRNDYWDDDGYGHETEQYKNTMCALDMAIEALKQMDLLDKYINMKALLHIINYTEQNRSEKGQAEE